MQLESAGDKSAVSPKGAMGLIQVMPETYAELRFRHHPRRFDESAKPLE
jgi:soluble lytic murein transglycosylase-like protein